MQRIPPCGRIVDHRGKDRLLLIFSPELRDARLTEQTLDIQRNRAGLLERDMVVYRVVMNGESNCDGSVIDDRTAREIRSQFGVPDQAFQVILVGKDGTVKLRRLTPTPLRQVFSLVDSMPMRRREMRERKGEVPEQPPDDAGPQ